MTHVTLVLNGYLVGGTRIVTCTNSEVGVQWAGNTSDVCDLRT